MSNEITKEEIEKVEKLEGEVRGAVFKTDEHFILKHFGERGVKKVEEKLEEMGSPFSYSEIKKMNFYPIKMRIFSFLAISTTLGVDKEGIEKMGSEAPQISFLIKVFTKYFMSSSKTLQKVGEIWERHYTVGRIEAVKVDEDKGEALFRLHKANFHPFFCNYLAGYFSSITGMVVGEEVEGKETKCYFNGEEYHEFYMQWKPL